MCEFYVLMCLREFSDGSIEYQLQGLYFEKSSAFRKIKNRGWKKSNVDFVIRKCYVDPSNFDINPGKIIYCNYSGIPFRF